MRWYLRWYLRLSIYHERWTPPTLWARKSLISEDRSVRVQEWMAVGRCPRSFCSSVLSGEPLCAKRLPIFYWGEKTSQAIGRHLTLGRRSGRSRVKIVSSVEMNSWFFLVSGHIRAELRFASNLCMYTSSNAAAVVGQLNPNRGKRTSKVNNKRNSRDFIWKKGDGRTERQQKQINWSVWSGEDEDRERRRPRNRELLSVGWIFNGAICARDYFFVGNQVSFIKVKWTKKLLVSAASSPCPKF